jgi:hypothetical protein
LLLAKLRERYDEAVAFGISEQAVKAAKRHRAVSGYWHTPRTLARWCRIHSYLDSTANHGMTALDAITRVLAGEPLATHTNPLRPDTESQITGSLNGHPTRAHRIGRGHFWQCIR